MTNQIHVQICVGTYSYVMGGADLVDIEKKLPAQLLSRVKITGATELKGVDEKTMKPPYVAVNGIIISEANENKVIRAIEKEINAD